MKRLMFHPVTTHTAATIVGAGIIFAMLAAAMSQSFEVPLPNRPGKVAVCLVVDK